MQHQLLYKKLKIKIKASYNMSYFNEHTNKHIYIQNQAAYYTTSAERDAMIKAYIWGWQVWPKADKLRAN